MKEAPMDYEFKLHWKDIKEREEKIEPFKYVSPLKKRKMSESVILAKEIPPTQNSLNFQVDKQEPSSNSVTKKIIQVDVKSALLNLPFVLISYLHLFINMLLISIFSYTLINLFIVVRNDIANKIFEGRNALNLLINESRKNYEINRCHPNTRVPALEKICTEWECVMNRNANSVEITKIVVEVCGELLDGFVRKFSLRSCCLGACFFVLFLIFRNYNLKHRN